MIDRMGAFLPLAGTAVTAPRTALREVLRIPAGRPEIAGFAALVIVLNLMMGIGADIVLPAPEGAEPISLFVAAIIHAVSLFGGAVVLNLAGMMFRGGGDFDACLKTFAWFYFVMLLAQGAFLVVLLFLPPAMAGLALLLLLVFSMVQLTASVMEVHGFTRPFLVVLGILGASVLFGFVMLVVLTVLGVELPAPTPPQ